jgi:hypothetical protein
MQSPEGAAYCDFCKEPFAKKKEKPKAQDPLTALPKEKVLELSEQLLKSDVPPPPSLPAWVRPLAWTFLALCVAASAVSLWLLHQRYEERQQDAPPAGAPTIP